MVLEIPGVDNDSFHHLFEDDLNLFLTVLSTYVEKAPIALDKLEKIASAISKETLPAYATCVHGIKGACANVCAEEAREKAKKLEKMAEDGDLAGVIANNGDFLNYMANLLTDIQKWLKNNPE
jgi:HPt (histidine-containing phosphotransfer) domain-containing protein